jgi:molybdopterin converting factor small subunit
MPTIRIPAPLRTYTAGQSEVALQGDTVQALVQDLVVKYPNIKPHLFAADGTLRPYVNLFLGEENIKDLSGLETPLKIDDRLLMIPSIAGG